MRTGAGVYCVPVTVLYRKEGGCYRRAILSNSLDDVSCLIQLQNPSAAIVCIDSCGGRKTVRCLRTKFDGIGQEMMMCSIGACHAEAVNYDICHRARVILLHCSEREALRTNY